MTAVTRPWSLRPPWSQSWPPSSRCLLQAQLPLWTWHIIVLITIAFAIFIDIALIILIIQIHASFLLILLQTSNINRWSREPGIACTRVVDKCKSWKDGSTGYTCWQKITYGFPASMPEALKQICNWERPKSGHQVVWSKYYSKIDFLRDTQIVREPFKNVLADFARQGGGGTPPVR